MSRWKSSLLVVSLAVAVLAFTRQGRDTLWAIARPHHTVASRLAEFGDSARARMLPAFRSAGVTYPPKVVTLLGIKNAGYLEVYAGAHPDSQAFIVSYRIQKASGELGPKLREGDRQVPEGVYGVESLNPNSRFHVALRVNYPNAFDRAQGKRDGRRRLGGDIMIHGKAVSIGCLAMGDQVAENLFVLAAETGLPNIRVLLVPVDFRRGAIAPASMEPWVGNLYADLSTALRKLPLGRPRAS